MCEAECPYLDRPEKLEYPTETWSAQDIRKSDVLAWAALCTSAENRSHFLNASRRFYEDVFARLPALPTHTFTRPVVLLLTRGYALRWLQMHAAARLEAAPVDVAPAERIEFEPQKVRAFRRLKLVAAVALAGFVGLVAAWLA
jgi:hypothetical protein